MPYKERTLGNTSALITKILWDLQFFFFVELTEMGFKVSNNRPFVDA